MVEVQERPAIDLMLRRAQGAKHALRYDGALLRQHHFSCFGKARRRQAIEIHTRCDTPTEITNRIALRQRLTRMLFPMTGTPCGIFEGEMGY
jgi:hypothetical protein